MTVTAYPAIGDVFSVNRVQQSQLPLPRTLPMIRPHNQPLGIGRAGTDLFPVQKPTEFAEPGDVMNPADRIAWHVQQAQASRCKAGESGAIADWTQRAKEARPSAS